MNDRDVATVCREVGVERFLVLFRRVVPVPDVTLLVALRYKLTCNTELISKSPFQGQVYPNFQALQLSPCTLFLSIFSTVCFWRDGMWLPLRRSIF